MTTDKIRTKKIIGRHVQFSPIRLYDSWKTPMGVKWRLTQQFPMAFLGIIDSLIYIFSLGFISTGFALSWGMRQSLRWSRKKRLQENPPQPPIPEKPRKPWLKEADFNDAPIHYDNEQAFAWASGWNACKEFVDMELEND